MGDEDKPNNLTSAQFGDGEYTAQQLAANVMEHAEDVEILVVVGRLKESGALITGYSDGSTLMKLGMLQGAQEDLLSWVRTESDGVMT